MFICYKCGSSVADDSEFCSACGTLLRVKDDKKICNNCKAIIRKDSNFCCACGEKQNISLDKENVFSLNESISKEEFYNSLSNIIEQMDERTPRMVAPNVNIKVKHKNDFLIKWDKDSNVDGYNIYIYSDKEGSETVEHRQIFDVNKNYSLYKPCNKNEKYYVAVSYFKIINNIVYESDCSSIKKLK